MGGLSFSEEKLRKRSGWEGQDRRLGGRDWEERWEGEEERCRERLGGEEGGETVVGIYKQKTNKQTLKNPCYNPWKSEGDVSCKSIFKPQDTLGFPQERCMKEK